MAILVTYHPGIVLIPFWWHLRFYKDSHGKYSDKDPGRSSSGLFKITPLSWVRILKILTENNSQTCLPNIQQKEKYMEPNKQRVGNFGETFAWRTAGSLSVLFPRLKETFSFRAAGELQPREGCFRPRAETFDFPPYLFPPGLWDHPSEPLFYSNILTYMSSIWVC